MIRTINEKKATRLIFVGFIINYLSIFILGWSIRKPMLLLGAIGVGGYFVGLMLLCYNFYSLGWEYKKIDLDSQTSETKSGGEGE